MKSLTPKQRKLYGKLCDIYNAMGFCPVVSFPTYLLGVARAKGTDDYYAVYEYALTDF